MKSANNPENQQQQGARGSVQINSKATAFNPVPWGRLDDGTLTTDF